MPITSKDIENVTFSKPPIGKRGYNEDEVDAFLDLVQADLATIEETVEDLTDQLQNQAAAPLPQPPAPAPPPPAPVVAPDPPSVQASRILELAEKTADQVVREAEELADKTTREARDKAGELLAEARYEASKLVEAARREAEETEQRLVKLREFETNYRGRLDTYIESQLFALRADGKVEPAS